MNSKSFSLKDDFQAVSYEQWREQVEQDLAGAPFDKKLVTRLYEGINLQPIYTAGDWSAEGDPSGFPGHQPFTRGDHALGQLKGWSICQAHAHPNLEVARDQIRRDTQRGANAVWLRLDRAARSGRDGENEPGGLDGMMVYSVDDLNEVLGDVDLSQTGVMLEAGSQFLPAAALMASVWARCGIGDEAARGGFNADPLGVLADEGRLSASLDRTFDAMAALTNWTAERYPNVTSILVSTAPYHESGATSVQDLAFSIATGLAYLKALTARGVELDTACRQMVFEFSVGTHFFQAIAKLRAARKLWSRVTEACGASPDARAMKMHVDTSHRVLTERDPWVNILRGTATTFAAAVSGADSISVAPFDAALGLPDDFSRRIARNTQVILQEESHLARVVDPAGGSWFLEKLTDELADKAWALFQQIEAQGGMIEALQKGWVPEQIEEAFQARLKDLARRKEPVTGVSEFPNVQEESIHKEPPDYEALRKQAAERLTATRGAASEAVERAEAALQANGLNSVEFVGALVAAAGSGATVGQMAGLVPVDGTPAEMNPLPMRPFSQPFEQLRDASEQHEAQTGKRPQVFLANMGPVAHHIARANYTGNFFEAGGFEVLTNEGFAKPEQAAEAFKASGAQAAVICSSDKIYEELAADTARALKEAGAQHVLLAGRPGEMEAQLREAGVDMFIFIGCNVLDTLRTLLKDQGVI